MMTVEMMKRMKVKKIDEDKAGVVKQEVCSRDEVTHVQYKCFSSSMSCTGGANVLLERTPRASREQLL